MFSAFVLEKNEYQRDLNIVKHAIEDYTEYLHVHTGKDKETCRSFAEKKLADGTFKVKDPELLMIEREKGADKNLKETTFTRYISDIENQKGLMAPTLTVYEDSDKRPSLLSEYTEGNVQKRKKVKKRKFELEREGDEHGAKLADILQSTFKIMNNSLSGAHASAHTILYNKSTHPTLTSTCRSATAYANANNERFLSGNRHYRNPDIAMQNIVSITRLADYELIEQAMSLYKLAIPTVDVVYNDILRSTDLYWKDDRFNDKLRNYLTKLPDVKRAAFYYSNNFWALKELNPELARDFLNRISSMAETPVENPDHYIDLMDDDQGALVSVICNPILKNVAIPKLKAAGMLKEYGIVAATVAGIVNTIDEYSTLIRAFWVTKSPPASMASFTQSVRRVALISDTDSTIFTTQDLVNWFMGGISFEHKAVSLCAAITYMASMTTIHLLAQMSTAMGVKEKYLHMLAMKNEFLIPVLIMTNRAKHYASYISVQEGNVKKELKFESKGVALKNSKLPKNVITESDQFIRDIMGTIMRGESISVAEKVKKVVAMEREISDSIDAGDLTYLSQINVNERDAYKNPETSVFRHHEVWQNAYADKYGEAPELPYKAVKVSVTTASSSKLGLWINSIEDEVMRNKLKAIIEETGMTGGMGQMLVPLDNVSQGGIPKETLKAVNKRKIISETMESFYIMLESLHVYVKDEKVTKLLSDMY